MTTPQQPTPQERALIAAVMTWIAGLRAAISTDDIVLALGSGSAQAILYALGRARQLVLDLLPAAREEGAAAVAALDGAARLSLRFDIHDPKFLSAVEQQGAKAIREIDNETQKAVQRLVSDGYRNGWHPRVFAPMIHETVGLTTKQSLAVANQFRANIESGMSEVRAQMLADRYAKRLGKLRATTIAISETIHAANLSRIAGYEQARQHGLMIGKRPMIEWDSVQTDPNEICFQMNGQRVPLGSTFEGGLMPGFVHPRCRCVPQLVLE